jgi:hypothetical protein
MKKLLLSAALALALAAPAQAQYAPIGADNGATGQVNVATTTSPATLIAAARVGGPRVGRVNITIINKTGTDQLCIGFSNAVTATTGQCLPAIAGASITLSTTSAIYGVVPTTTQTVTYDELF